MSKDKMTPEETYNEIAKAQAEAMLELPEGYTYGHLSSAAKFVDTFVEGARWQRTQMASAINNTYGKKINPEAVPELLRALQEVILVSDRKTDIYDRAKAAIEKAKL